MTISELAGLGLEIITGSNRDEKGTVQNWQITALVNYKVDSVAI